MIDLEKTGFQMLVEAVAQSNWIPPEYMANDWLADCCHFLRTGEGIQADALASLSAQLAVKEAENAALKDRMIDMMPIAGGNPMRNAGRSFGVSSALSPQADAALGDK